MGMAASQARLLMLTARIHDVEYEAQMIQQAKVQLATQSNAAEREYLAALDDQTLALSMLNSNGQTSLITANFNTLFSSGRAQASDGSVYALYTARGQLVVEDDVYDAYQEHKDKDPYELAMGMLTGDWDVDLKGKENEVGKKTENQNLQDKRNAILKDFCGGGEDINEFVEDPNGEYTKADYEKALASYRNQLYKSCEEEIYKECTGEEKQSDQSYTLFQNYLNIFRLIEANGGYIISISDFDGPDGDAANNSDWLENNIKNGTFTIYKVKTDKLNGEITTDATSPSSDTSLSYVNTGDIDSTALKKAEAKHEKALRDINNKDKRYDLELSKLETERSALTTQYDSLKKVIQDNIDRTFGIFS